MKDAADIKRDLDDAVEGMGHVFPFAALVDVPVLVRTPDGTVHNIEEVDIQWTNDEHGKRIDRIIWKAV